MENFLEKILIEKQDEVNQMLLETPKTVRQTKGLVQRLSENPNHLQVIGEVKRA